MAQIFNRRLNIFTGHFGSGKTEVAVNYAAKLSAMYEKTAIVDFDIVNPFFRTADARKTLEDMGVWVVAPLYANTNVDVPALPPEINTLFEKKQYRTVFDVGGDDIGARALSRYREDIQSEEYEMFFVVNSRRPMTDTVEKIIQMAREIEFSSRLKITGMINNTNLLNDTRAEDVLEGGKLIAEASEILKLPVAFISGFGPVIEELKGQTDIPLFEMDKLIKLPWD